MDLVATKHSFASGEIDEELYGRQDFRRYITGLALCKNFVVGPKGGLFRRPPTKYMGPAYADAIFIPHHIRQKDSYIVELGVLPDGQGTIGKARFWRQGGIVEVTPGTVYEIEHSFTLSDFEALRWITSGDRIYFTHPTAGMKQMSRLSNINWTYEDIPLKNGPFLDENKDESKKILASDRSGDDITLTASGFTFDEGLAGSFMRFKEFDGAANYKGDAALIISSWKANETIAGKNQTKPDYRRYDENVYKPAHDGNLSAGTEPPVHEEGVVSSGDGQASWEFVRKSFGVVQITSVASGGATAQAKVLLDIPYEYLNGTGAHYWSEGAFSEKNGYPSALAIYKSRLAFGLGIRIFFSVANDYLDFTPSTLPDEAFNYRIGTTSEKANNVEWMLSAKIFLVGTTGEEFRVFAPSSGGFSLDNFDVDMVGEGGYGGNGGVSVGAELLQIDRSEEILHRIAFSLQEDTYLPSDISIQSEHLLSAGIKKIVWQRAPKSVAWVLLRDGSIVAVTYKRDQETIGWHRHDFGGVVEDIEIMESIDGRYDELWLRIRRGSDVNIELMLPYFNHRKDDLNAHPYLDCQYVFSDPGNPTNVITLPTFYFDKEVGVFTADGWCGLKTAVGTQLTLDDPVDWAVIGFNYESRARLLPTPISVEGRNADGAPRLVEGIRIRTIAGPGVKVGRKDAPYEKFELLRKDHGNFNQPPELSNKIHKAVIAGAWSREDFTDIVQDEPFAATILTAHLHTEVDLDV